MGSSIMPSILNLMAPSPTLPSHDPTEEADGDGEADLTVVFPDRSQALLPSSRSLRPHTLSASRGAGPTGFPWGCASSVSAH